MRWQLPGASAHAATLDWDLLVVGGNESAVAAAVPAVRLSVEGGWEPVAARVDGKRLTGVTFTKGSEKLEVRARLMIDASDWGDVIQLSGAKWSAGPDPKSRFDEPSAPEEITEENGRALESACLRWAAARITRRLKYPRCHPSTPRRPTFAHGDAPLSAMDQLPLVPCAAASQDDGNFWEGSSRTSNHARVFGPSG